MKDKRQKPLDKFSKENEGFFVNLYQQVRLIGRLLADRRVNFLLKLLPIGALVYLVVPTDLLPLIPVDDALVLYLGGTLFITLCPPDIVREHQDAIRNLDKKGNAQSEPDDVIDAEFQELKPEEDR